MTRAGKAGASVPVWDKRPTTPTLRDQDAFRRRLLVRAALGSAAFGAASRPIPALAGMVAGGNAVAHETALQDDIPFWFGFIGDTPYSKLEENSLRRILSALAAEPLVFVLHAGDIKSSLEGCDDALMSSRLRLLDECPHPLILTPGDNEWTDCKRSLTAGQPGGPLERLDWLRGQAFRHPLSLGRRRMLLEQQGPYLPGAEGASPSRQASDQGSPRLPENLRWRVGSLQFCTLHVVGSGNGESRKADLAHAWLLRQQANGDWLNDTVQRAIRESAAGLVIALHANLRFGADRSDGWERMRSLIIAAAVAFDGPVLLLHGDTHRFRNDRLLQRSHGLANFQRVECFGSPFSSSWVQIRWDPSLARAGAGTESDPFQVSTRALP